MRWKQAKVEIGQKSKEKQQGIYFDCSRDYVIGLLARFPAVSTFQINRL
jgi:hypothetical protein